MNPHVIEAVLACTRNGMPLQAFANPNWLCPIMLDGARLWDLRPRMMASVLHAVSDARRLELDCPDAFEQWFGPGVGAQALAPAEIRRVYLDEVAFRARLRWFDGVARYCLIGGDYADWLLPLGRDDIIARMAAIAREEAMIPVAITHLPSLTLGDFEALGLRHHWILLSRDRHLLSARALHRTLAACSGSITAFRVLGMGRHVADLDAALYHVVEQWGIRSLVVGVDNEAQAEQTCSRLRAVLDATAKMED